MKGREKKKERKRKIHENRSISSKNVIKKKYNEIVGLRVADARDSSREGKLRKRRKYTHIKREIAKSGKQS